MTLKRWFFLIFLTSGVAIAQDIQLVGSFEQPVNRPNTTPRLMAAPGIQHITLLKFQLSEKAQYTVHHRIEKTMNEAHKPLLSLSRHPRQVQLGMSNVPVLDQAGHGSCVTFANTAAIDAALNKGDYISQLCLLQLGRYLENNAYIPSGWDGSLGGIVLNQIDTFGLVSKAQQSANGCGGLTEYPHGEVDPTSAMSVEQYHQISEKLDQVVWFPLIDLNRVASDKTDMDTLLNHVKDALNEGDRLTFGVLLPDVELGFAGAVGAHHGLFDSWVLTPEIAADIEGKLDFAGHEMVITGYNDDAIAIDLQGHVHAGLLTLRNSWGKNIGDKGNFYMSYDYFKALAVEVQQISALSSQN